MPYRRFFLTLLDSALLLFCTTTLVAQLNRGAIEGSVTDPQGAAAAGVEVTVTAVATNVVASSKTNSSGYYRAEALVPGTYRAHFAARGFAAVDITAIEVAAGQVIRLDTKLKVGSINEKIEVTADLPVVQTDASNFSTTLPSNLI